MQAEWREHECFLRPRDNFSDKCAEPRKPLFLLWGDSHAAALYPGFRDLGEKFNVGIAQYTIAACAPLVGWESPIGKFCSQANENVLRMVSQLKPDAILLHANWSSTTNSKYDLDKLKITVEKVRQNSANSSIYLIGPVPQYSRDLPKALWKCYGKNVIPEHSNCEISHSIADLDLTMEKMSRELKIQYISAYKELCVEQGCLVRIGDDITTTDYGHLTPNAARYFIQRIRGALPAITR